MTVLVKGSRRFSQGDILKGAYDYFQHHYWGKGKAFQKSVSDRILACKGDRAKFVQMLRRLGKAFATPPLNKTGVSPGARSVELDEPVEDEVDVI